jgi:hypothetical protein
MFEVGGGHDDVLRHFISRSKARPTTELRYQEI